jgi:hypothetical protein
MDRWLFVFGLLFFVSCFVIFVMSLFGDSDGMMFTWTLFGMLNASIAMGVSEILSVVKEKN